MAEHIGVVILALSLVLALAALVLSLRRGEPE